MRIQAIFESDKKRIVLFPESPGEQLLLGSVLSEDVRGYVSVEHEGHSSHKVAKIVNITLKEGDCS